VGSSSGEKVSKASEADIPNCISQLVNIKIRFEGDTDDFRRKKKKNSQQSRAVEYSIR